MSLPAHPRASERIEGRPRLYQSSAFLDKSFQEYLKFGHDAGGQFVGGPLGYKVVARAVHFQHGVWGGNQLQSGAHFRSGAEWVAGTVNEERGRGQPWEMAGTKLIRLSRRMKRVGEQEQAIRQLGLFRDEHGRLSSAVRMATQKYVTIFLLPHDRDGAAQSVPVPDSAGGGRRSMWAQAAEWQIEPQNGEPRPGKRIGHLYQQFRLAVCASDMREYNGLSRGPRRYVKPAVNGGVAVRVIKRNRHEAVNREDVRRASVFASVDSVKCPVSAAVSMGRRNSGSKSTRRSLKT